MQSFTLYFLFGCTTLHSLIHKKFKIGLHLYLDRLCTKNANTKIISDIASRWSTLDPLGNLEDPVAALPAATRVLLVHSSRQRRPVLLKQFHNDLNWISIMERVQMQWADNHGKQASPRRGPREQMSIQHCNRECPNLQHAQFCAIRTRVVYNQM